MSMIRVWNTNISNEVNRDDAFYKVWIGQDPFTPESTIVASDDYNCGAICNELEFVRLVSNYYVESLSVDKAEDEELQDLILAFVDMPRRNQLEADATYRLRYKFVVVEKANRRRTTRWAILDAINYFIADMDTVQVVEIFDVKEMYFQVRIEGVVITEDAIFINNTAQAYVDQNFIGGPGVGEVISYIGELIQMIKAAGVDFDVMFVDQNRTTLDSDCIIGTVQKYLSSDAKIKATISTTLNSDARIV